jgi:hypothetical protein
MLSYHPALDPEHAALRTLRLSLHALPSDMETDRAKLLAYYMVFPESLAELRLPPQLGKWKRRYSPLINHYYSSAPHSIAFARTGGSFDSAIRLLVAKGVYDRSAVAVGRLTLVTSRVSESLHEIATRLDSEESELLRFLVVGLRDIPLHGPDGLKHRSGLLEHRYDAG